MVVEAVSSRFDRIISSDATLEKITDGHIFTEGPVWNSRDKSLTYVDIIGDTIWNWQEGIGKRVLRQPSGKVNGLTFDKQGRLLIAGWNSRNITRLNPEGTITVLASQFEGKKLNCPNDIVARSDGTIFFTDPAGGLSYVGMGVDDLQQYLDFSGVYRLEPEDGSITLLTDEVPRCNGLAFSPDESLLYISDTGQYHIKVFDVDPHGTLRKGRIFAELKGKEEGVLDGMKVDVEGHVYCTGPGGIWVLDPDGICLGRIRIPGHASNLAWGEDDWRTIFISARSSVYRIRLNIQGIPV
ncbi:MAG: SMP-30/gluconolactonase/LRE family protein [Nitrospirota bacterium]|nr:MAG: SMP-30/gluconolactonase/LRE family protein [Nitrospirota bacterium]